MSTLKSLDMACIHCLEEHYHRDGCIAMLAAMRRAREVVPDAGECLDPIGRIMRQETPGTVAAMVASSEQPTASGELRFVAVKATVLQGGATIARAVSKTMAKRIANALNKHRPTAEGV